ncbi:sensor histidine kinase [Pseudanabaena sp. UWO310]|uniref:sensor histidine kinase n=1 Tax=Pseudanabaena sp. UWO310 TaxID=2480795 RepID=UPI0011596D54|nr:ATP-binding protein [Pseudanabaena sp. UWO310]TYQ29811.1 hypothetical protein PseudUWO310_11915 [Pseudanabaena sp. UWO310]
MIPHKAWQRNARMSWLLHIILLGSFGILGVVMFWAQLHVPIVIPSLILVAIGLLILFALRLNWQKNLINEQQCELDRLHAIEQTAVISQTRKLLHRIAADIHDGPLQELKLAMDQLEFLQMNSPDLDFNPILDRLEDLGDRLRQQLNQTRELALEITPDLREGLGIGITKKLQHLVESGELKLQIVQNLQPLAESQLNSSWLEAREDIYRFFTEAIANVIHHAQPPQGTATKVKVILKQQDRLCTMIVENDGEILDRSIFELTAQKRQRGGYGMKLMQAIANDLPNGIFERITLVEGGIRVQLTWHLLRSSE